MEEIKRLFFGWEIIAPWPSSLPNGKLLAEVHRHLTLAFLGEVPFQKIAALLPSFPSPSSRVGLSGYFDKCLFLPKSRHPNVVAWHAICLEDESLLLSFQHELVQWLSNNDIHLRRKESFLPHVTISRRPFLTREWKEAFTPLPFYTHTLHLYESLGHSRYQSCWQLTLKPPLEEMEHTADIAFLIRGNNWTSLCHHALTALAFHFPPLFLYAPPYPSFNHLDEVIFYLNDVVAKADAKQGCPFKAVSFHGKVVKEESNTLRWEMFVDV
jgi:RNA 2',3'-cyclic 3'-phosphodiesterase